MITDTRTKILGVAYVAILVGLALIGWGFGTWAR